MSDPWANNRGTIGPPAGWLSDPSDFSLERYWDGSSWTEFRRPRAQVSPQNAGHSVLGTHRAGHQVLLAPNRATFSQESASNTASDETADTAAEKEEWTFERVCKWILIFILIVIFSLGLDTAVTLTGITKDVPGECDSGSGRAGMIGKAWCEVQKAVE